MNLEELHKQLAATPLSFRRKLRDYLRYPTERNACYTTGYVAALEDARLFKTGDAASYWLALIGRAEANATMCRELIAEMYNTSVEHRKEPSVEDRVFSNNGTRDYPRNDADNLAAYISRNGTPIDA